MRRLPILLAALFAAVPVPAQELLLLGGGTQHIGGPSDTYAWSLEYAQGLGDHAFATLSWLNEGHLPDHHRDGPAAQIWGRVNLLDRRLSLAAGIGPYHFFDTVQTDGGASYTNDHGGGLIFSVGLTRYTASRWLFHARANRIETHGKIDTTAILLAAGYQLAAPDRPGPRPRAPAQADRTTDNEIAMFLGRAILNSFESESSTAFSVEYRRGLARYVDATVAWLDEGGEHVSRRHALTGQFWLVREFFEDHFALGAGAGAYYVLERDIRPETSVEGEEDEYVSGLVSLTLAYRFDRRWLARVSWSRVVTGYDRDTDVILLGAGYRF